jgi:hypothetical protein
MKKYIDADALLEKVWDADTRIGYVQVVDVGDIQDAPAADVEPVVRGECEHCSSRIQATNDGQPFSQEWYLTVNGCKFCPQCGRKLHMERSGSGE